MPYTVNTVVTSRHADRLPPSRQPHPEDVAFAVTGIRAATTRRGFLHDSRSYQHHQLRLQAMGASSKSSPAPGRPPTKEAEARPLPEDRTATTTSATAATSQVHVNRPRPRNFGLRRKHPSRPLADAGQLTRRCSRQTGDVLKEASSWPPVWVTSMRRSRRRSRSSTATCTRSRQGEIRLLLTFVSRAAQKAERWKKVAGETARAFPAAQALKRDMVLISATPRIEVIRRRSSYGRRRPFRCEPFPSLAWRSVISLF
jgi:hypothetical protein